LVEDLAATLVARQMECEKSVVWAVISFAMLWALRNKPNYV